MPSNGYRVFISHGSPDLWVAAQIARAVRDAGADPFLDETDIPKGANFRERVHKEIARSDELVALFTPWSSRRSWVWVEIGAAWGKGIPVVAVFYGLKPEDLEESGQGNAILDEINFVELNELDTYIGQLSTRAQGSSA